MIIGVLCGIFLLHVPGWYAAGELPLMPALLAAEAGLAGLGLCTYGIYRFSFEDRLRAHRAASAKATHPDAPWLANRQWAKRTVASSSIGPAGFLWIFALNWWGVLLFAIANRGEELLLASWPEKALMYVFPLIGIITLWVAIKHTVWWWRYGSSTLEIETLPGRPGRSFEATIKTKAAAKPKRAYRVRLTGHERVWSRAKTEASDISKRRGDAKDDEPFAEVQQSIPPSKMLLAEGVTSIRISLPIPADAPSSGPVGTDREVIWKIMINSTGKSDPRYEAAFEVPVFRSSG